VVNDRQVIEHVHLEPRLPDAPRQVDVVKNRGKRSSNRPPTPSTVERRSRAQAAAAWSITARPPRRRFFK